MGKSDFSGWRIRDDPAIPLAQESGISLQHPIDIDVLGVSLHRGGGNLVPAQNGNELHGLVGTYSFHPFSAFKIALQRRQFIFRREHQFTARRQQGVF